MSVQAIESALVARLEERLKAAGLLAYVYDAGSYAQVSEESQLTPSAAVVYNGYTPGDASGNSQAVDLEFLVVLVTRNATDYAQGGGARDDVSPIFDALLAALIGWRPTLEGGVFPSPFKLAPAPGAQISQDGFAYWPVTFTIRRTYRGTP